MCSVPVYITRQDGGMEGPTREWRQIKMKYFTSRHYIGPDNLDHLDFPVSRDTGVLPLIIWLFLQSESGQLEANKEGN